MTVAVIKYNAGNVFSVMTALGRLGVAAELTDDPRRIRAADKVIFPGVGEASSAMRYLRERGLDDVLRSLMQPVLGICLGLQLLCEWSEEGDTECLGVFPHQVRRFEPVRKVPHMGWNTITNLHGPLFSELDEPYVYFVHSYYVELGEYTTARSDYIVPFSAALGRDNLFAVQFHPEKSGTDGMKLLENFLTGEIEVSR